MGSWDAVLAAFAAGIPTLVAAVATYLRTRRQDVTTLKDLSHKVSLLVIRLGVVETAMGQRRVGGRRRTDPRPPAKPDPA